MESKPPARSSRDVEFIVKVAESCCVKMVCFTVGSVILHCHKLAGEMNRLCYRAAFDQGRATPMRITIAKNISQSSPARSDFGLTLECRQRFSQLICLSKNSLRPDILRNDRIGKTSLWIELSARQYPNGELSVPFSGASYA